jgi:hypothetical protein
MYFRRYQEEYEERMKEQERRRWEKERRSRERTKKDSVNLIACYVLLEVQGGVQRANEGAGEEEQGENQKIFG